jgi:hypothetical protein
MKRCIYFLITCIFIFTTACKDDEIAKKDDGRKTDSEGSYTTDIAGPGGWDGTSGDGSGIGQDSTVIDTLQAGVLTAGEWNDLDNWDFFTELYQETELSSTLETWNYNFLNRYSVIVKDAANKPVVDCTVALLSASSNILWTTKTDNFGKAELWLTTNDSLSNNCIIKVSTNVEDKTINTPIVYNSGVNEVYLSSTYTASNKADIMFVVDATGSMCDEIEYLKTEVMNVIESVKSNKPGISFNTASVFYRDEGDDFVTRFSPFTTNIETTVNYIKNQSCGGGGDFPEAVHEALKVAIEDQQWSDNAITRIIFLVLDAPPHENIDVINKISSEINHAASMGIKIIPITASGIDKPTEFIMRSFAIATNGTYVFLTDDSGVGGEHLQPTIGEYEVELLNALMVRLIEKYTTVNN